jgi:hypothetical protein
MKQLGYCVQVLVKTADATIGSSWEMAPVKGTGEYIFKTSEEAEKYALDEYGEGRQWKVTPVKTDENNPK